MEINEVLKQVWPEWTISELIGAGQYGKVYRVEKKSDDQIFTAALKAIELPFTKDEIATMKATGMDDESIQGYMEETAILLKKEIDIMQKLKSAANIVTIEDSAVIKKTDEIGWFILIRMELLESLTRYSQKHGMQTEDFIRLGMDMCSALTDCEKIGVIHRDIKPENIFVNEFGTYKLGDFGIARKMEQTKMTMSRKGTELYMAPEVIKGEKYDSTVDIYSLGIMLYRFLNKGRMPFYPPYPERITPAAVAEAVQRKNSGEDFPNPAEADERLSAIIKKACAFNSSDRYQKASELKNALIEWNVNQKNALADAGLKKDDIPKTKEKKTEESSQEIYQISTKSKTIASALSAGLILLFFCPVFQHAYGWYKVSYFNVTVGVTDKYGFRELAPFYPTAALLIIPLVILGLWLISKGRIKNKVLWLLTFVLSVIELIALEILKRLISYYYLKTPLMYVYFACLLCLLAAAVFNLYSGSGIQEAVNNKITQLSGGKYKTILLVLSLGILIMYFCPVFRETYHNDSFSIFNVTIGVIGRNGFRDSDPYYLAAVALIIPFIILVIWLILNDKSKQKTLLWTTIILGIIELAEIIIIKNKDLFNSSAQQVRATPLYYLAILLIIGLIGFSGIMLKAIKAGDNSEKTMR